MSTNFWYNY